MSKKQYTADQLKDMAADYFTSNPDVSYLVASTHDGVFYRPENAGYAQAGADANDGQLVMVSAESDVTPITTAALNTHVNAVAAAFAGKITDLVGYFSAHLNRVANGEAPGKVLADLLAGVLPVVDQDSLDGFDLTDDLDEQPTGLAELVAGATHFSFPDAAPASTDAAAPAPAAKPARKAAAPKKATAKAAAPAKVAKAAKSPKIKPSTKSAE
jgi:hypothetical protein